MKSYDLLTNHELQQGLLRAFLAMASSTAAAVRARNITTIVGGGIMMLALLLRVVQLVLGDVIEITSGSRRAARGFDRRLTRAAGIVIAIAAVGGLLLARVIH
jgi:hypothetical protein